MASFRIITTEKGRKSDLHCAECGSQVRKLGHELVCSSCGLVQHCAELSELYLGNQVSNEAHFVGYSPMIVSGLGSEISSGTGSLKDARGRSMSSGRKQFYLRLRSVSDDIRLKSRTSELRTIRLMQRVSRLLHLPISVAEAAVLLYRKSIRKIRRGQVKHAALAACCLIYAARELSSFTTVSVGDVLGAFQSRGARLRTRDILRAGFLIQSGRRICKSEDYLYVILDRLISLINDRTLRRCGFEDRFYLLRRLLVLSERLLRAIGPDVRKGRNPLLVASAAIYASSRLLSPFSVKSPISQRVVALASGMAEYSVRETYEKLNFRSIRISLE